MTRPIAGGLRALRLLVYALIFCVGASGSLQAQKLFVGGQAGYNGSLVETGLIGSDTRFQSPQRSELQHGSTAGAFAQLALSKRLPLYGAAVVSGFWHTYQYPSPPSADYELFRGISSKKYTYSAIRTSLGLAWMKPLRPGSPFAFELGSGLSGLFIRDIFCYNRDRRCGGAKFTAAPPHENIVVESITVFVDYPNILAAYTRMGLSRQISARWQVGVSLDCQFGFGNFMTIASTWLRYDDGMPIWATDYRYINVDTGNAYLGQATVRYVLKP